jgi:hypothetical protein
MTSTSQLYGVSRATLYRLLRGERRPKDAHRADRGRPRAMPAPEIERWCEIVAAMKIRTTNRKGRHLSTVRTLQLLIDHGVETPDGFQKLSPGRLTASTLNRHLRRLGYDHDHMTRQPPAVRFQAEHSNALWHFDMSPSDLKHLEAPPWIDADRNGVPTLMLCSHKNQAGKIIWPKPTSHHRLPVPPLSASSWWSCRTTPGFRQAIR